LNPFLGLQVARQEMTFSFETAGHVYAVRAVFNGAQQMQYVHPTGTGNLNDFYIQVNGTLVARGRNTDQIHFNSGIIRFTEFSSDWNEQTGSGCIIENANLGSTRIEIGNSPKIHKNSVYEISVDGSPTISENTILGQIGIRGSPSIVNNSIINSTAFSLNIGAGSPTISHNIINCRIWVSDGLPTISDNTIFDGVHVDSRGNTVTISNNIITGLDSRLIFDNPNPLSKYIRFNSINRKKINIFGRYNRLLCL